MVSGYRKITENLTSPQIRKSSLIGREEVWKKTK